MLSFCEMFDLGLQRQKKKNIEHFSVYRTVYLQNKKKQKQTSSSGEYNKIISFLIN